MVSRSLSDDLQEPFHFILEKLALEPNTVLIVTMESNLDKNEWGYCLDVGDEVYEIEINANLNFEQRFRALAHEMVHVSQRQRGVLVYDEEKREDIWYGGEVPNVLGIKEERPWEMDAMNIEESLWREWRKNDRRKK